MANRVVVGLLALILVANGAVGYYAYTLTDRVDRLNEQVAALGEQNAAQAEVISDMTDEVSALAGDTGTRFDAVDGAISENLDRIDALAAAVTAGAARVTDVEGNLAGVERGLAAVRGQVSRIEPGLEADSVYRAVRGAVVEISDGDRTMGSGFVYDEDGHIVTAFHVIEDVDQIYIILPDGETSLASMVGTSPISDVAVLQAARPLEVTPVTIADSGDVAIGDPVLAVGSPMDLPGSLSVGVVSGLNRFEEVGIEAESRWLANLVQFDAPANFGNSGCPLFNGAGEVIGMVVARVEPDLGDGISYAVSSNKLRRVADEIIERGSYRYAYLGVEVGDLTPAEVEAAGRSTVAGAVVGGVAPNGPAQRAGVRVGDIILKIGDADIRGVADLTAYLGEMVSPGDSATLSLDRNGSPMEFTVTLGER